MAPRKESRLPKGTIIPNHIAIVLDGNGRWARSRGLPATKGHEAGAKAVRMMLDTCRNWGVHTVTLWGFSTENWKRPPKEVSKILNLIKTYIVNDLDEMKKQGVRFVHLGNKKRLPFAVLRWIEKAEKETASNNKYILNLAADYGGRDEILRAVKKIIEDGIPAKEIDEELFSSYLDTSGQPYPNPDLFIRTSGEQRTSGLMPWQMVYSEFYFETDHLPDMTPAKLRAAILDYSRRRRRFGAKDKVKHFKFKPELAAKFELGWWRLRNIPEGTKFRDFAIEHLKEQFGLSKNLTIEAASLMTQAVLEGNNRKWEKAKRPLGKFYKLLKDELKLAFEPSLAASLEVKLWHDLSGKENIKQAVEVEETAKQYYAEVYRISLLQAAKAAHLRVLAALERNMAERGMGEQHWIKAEDYLEKFYSALKERVA